MPEVRHTLCIIIVMLFHNCHRDSHYGEAVDFFNKIVTVVLM